MAIPLWDPNHPRGQVFMRKRHDLMSKLNDALPDLREMNINGLWAILPKYHVMDIATMERCRAGGISADQIERVVEFLKNDQVWKFHAFVKTLYDIGRCAYIDILLGDGASTNYEDQPAKHTDMAIPLWDPNHPDGRVFLRNRDDLMSRLNDTLPYLREMDTEGLWASLQKYKVMDRTTLQKCQAGEISADKIERVVIFLKKDQVWKFHAFVKALYDTHQTAYIDTLLGEGASKTYADQPAKHTGVDTEFDATAESIRTELKDSMTRLKGPQGFGALTEAPMVIEHMEKLGILTSAKVVEVNAATTQSEKVEKLIQHLLTSAPSKLVLFAWLLVAHGHTHQLPASITKYVARGLLCYNEDQIIIRARRYEDTAKLTRDKGTATKTAEEPTKETHAVEPPSTSTMTSAEGAGSVEKGSPRPHVAAEVSVATTKGPVQTAELTGDKGTTTKTTEDPTKETHADVSHLTFKRNQIYFGKNQITSDEKIQKLKKGFEDNEMLRKMKFEQSALTDEVADSMCTFLEKNGTLQTLDFSNSTFSPECMCKLMSALANNTSLVCLGFRASKFSDDIVEEICHFIKENKMMKVLAFDFSVFPDNAMKPLFRALTKNETLESLQFESTELKGGIMKEFGKFIGKCKALKELWFVDDAFTDSGVTELLDSLEKNETLEELWFHVKNAGDATVPGLNDFLKSKQPTNVRSVKRWVKPCLKVHFREDRRPYYYNIEKSKDCIKIVPEIIPSTPSEGQYAGTQTDGDRPGALGYAGAAKVPSISITTPTTPQVYWPEQDRASQNPKYPLKGRRGVCLVINIMDVLDAGKREGSDIDFRDVKDMFPKLNFDIICYNNLSAEAIKQAVLYLLRWKDYDCVAICLMSHGYGDYIYGCDDNGVHLESILTELSQSTLFDGKPKVLFVEACSGARINRGQGQPSSKLPQCPTCNGTGLEHMMYRDTISDSTTFPEYADIFYGHSSMKGTVSFRDSDGAWFIQAIIKVFIKRQAARNTDLSRLMIQVRNEMAKKEKGGWKQMPETRDYLLKELHFDMSTD